MSILNELENYVVEALEAIPEVTMIGQNGTKELDPNKLNAFKASVQDCGEYREFEDAFDRVFDALNKVGLSPARGGREWLGKVRGGIDVQDNAVLELDLVDQDTNEKIADAILIIELYHTTEGDYEMSTYIKTKGE